MDYGAVPSVGATFKYFLHTKEGEPPRGTLELKVTEVKFPGLIDTAKGGAEFPSDLLIIVKTELANK